MYKDLFRKEIVADIEALECGELTNLLPDLFTPYIPLVASDFNKALQNDVDELGLIDMICSHTDEELNQIKQEYQKSESLGTFVQLLI